VIHRSEVSYSFFLFARERKKKARRRGLHLASSFFHRSNVAEETGRGCPVRGTVAGEPSRSVGSTPMTPSCSGGISFPTVRGLVTRRRHDDVPTLETDTHVPVYRGLGGRAGRLRVRFNWRPRRVSPRTREFAVAGWRRPLPSVASVPQRLSEEKTALSEFRV